MTAQIVNLKRVRKAKARAAAEREAEANRAKFGQTKSEKTAVAAAARRSSEVLDGLKLTPAANQGQFPSTAEHDNDGDLDPGNCS
jgi:Domain of unknown function (DUF4169)